MKRIVYAFLLLSFCACKVRNGSENTFVTFGFAPIANSRIYYETKGSGNALLFLHSGFMNSRMWQPQMQYFSKKYQVIVCDMSGYGKTIDGDSAYYMYDAIKALLDTLHIRKTNVVGLSFGAVIATSFALHYPAYISRLVLASPGLQNQQPMLPADRFLITNDSLMKDAYFVKKDTALVASYFVHSWFDGPYRNAADMNAAVRNEAIQMAVSKLRKGFQHDPKEDTLPVIPRLHTLQMPVLVMAGDKDNAIIKANTDTLIRLIPGAEKLIIPGAAHMINMEQPKEFNAAVLRFLQQ